MTRSKIIKRISFAVLACLLLLVLSNCASTNYFKVSEDDPLTEVAKVTVGPFINIHTIDGEEVNIMADTAIGSKNTLYIAEGSYVLLLSYEDGNYRTNALQYEIIVEKNKKYDLAPKITGSFGNFKVEFVFKEIIKK